MCSSWIEDGVYLVDSIDFHCRSHFRLRHHCPAIHTRPRFSSSRLCRRNIVGRSNGPSLLAMGSCSFTTGWKRYTKTREMGKKKENFIVRKENFPIDPPPCILILGSCPCCQLETAEGLRGDDFHVSTWWQASLIGSVSLGLASAVSVLLLRGSCWN